MISSSTNWEEFGTSTEPNGSSPLRRTARSIPEIVLRDGQRATLPATPDRGATDSGTNFGCDEACLVAGEAQVVRIMGSLRLGRGPENDCLLLERGVSKRHAVIRADEAGEHWLLDLNTTNGTFLNDTRVEVEVRLRSGDRIRIGPYIFEFHHPGQHPARR